MGIYENFKVKFYTILVAEGVFIIIFINETFTEAID